MKRIVATSAFSLLLGLLAGGFGGYRIGSASNSEINMAEGAPDPFGPGVARNSLETTNSGDGLQPEVRLVEVEDYSASMDEAFRKARIPSLVLQDNSLMDLISTLQCRSYELNRDSGGIHIAIGHPLVHDPEFGEVQITLQAVDQSVKEILDTVSEQTGLVYTIRPCAVFWGKGESKRAEQNESLKP